MHALRQILAVLVLSSAGNAWAQMVLSSAGNARAQTQTLLDNTFVSPDVNMFTWEIGEFPAEDGGNIYDLGQSFMTGSNPVNNMIYQPRFGSTGDGQENLVFSLYSNFDNAPNSLLSQFAGPAVPTVGIDSLYYLDPSFTLSPETRYWIVGINTGTSLVQINSTADTTFDTSDGFTVGDVGLFFNGQWGIVQTVGDPNYQPTVFKLSGSVVPEPSTYALLAMSAAGALWWARRRR
jgi:hypothetical protein